jgi:Pyoverdine/dityrosine biosynthesis protein
MANLSPPQISLSAFSSSPEPVDIKHFTALEQKVDILVAQLQQLLPQRPKQAQSSLKELKPHSFAGLSGPSLPLTPDLSLPGTPALEAQSVSVVESETPSTKIAHQILDIIQRYGHNVGAKNAPGPWAGKEKFVAPVEEHVLKNETVQMVLPAFPFKSPNRKDKVLGNMPDLGEELALMHLNGLCESIAEVYEPGATVVIASDGLVYNGKCQV